MFSSSLLLVWHHRRNAEVFVFLLMTDPCLQCRPLQSRQLAKTPQCTCADSVNAVGRAGSGHHAAEAAVPQQASSPEYGAQGAGQSDGNARTRRAAPS